MTELPYPHLDGVEHHHVDVGDVRLHYAEAGRPDGEPIVLVHGWPQHWYVWRRVIPHLHDRFRIIAPDMRGFGWSDAPRSSYTKDELGRDIAELIRILDLRDVRLAGHDWGGAAVQHAALAVPDRVRSLTAICIAHLWASGRPTLSGVLAAAAYQPAIATPFLGQALQRFTPFVNLPFLASGGSRIWSAEERAVFVASFRQADRAEAASRVYRSFLLSEVRQRPPRQRLAMPALLLLGRNDPIVTEQLNAGASKAGFEVEVVDGGHWLPETQPELVAARIGR